MSHRPAARTTRARVAVGGALLALTLTGCSVSNPITTHMDYEPSDGLRVEIGDVRLGNAMVVGSQEGGEATLVGYVSNRGADAAEVTLSVAGAPGASFTVDAGRTVRLGPDQDEEVTVDALPVAPGAVVEVTVASDRDGSATGSLPVVDATLEEYAGLVP